MPSDPFWLQVKCGFTAFTSTTLCFCTPRSRAAGNSRCATKGHVPDCINPSLRKKKNLATDTGLSSFQRLTGFASSMSAGLNRFLVGLNFVRFRTLEGLSSLCRGSARGDGCRFTLEMGARACEPAISRHSGTRTWEDRIRSVLATRFITKAGRLIAFVPAKGFKTALEPARRTPLVIKARGRPCFRLLSGTSIHPVRGQIEMLRPKHNIGALKAIRIRGRSTSDLQQQVFLRMEMGSSFVEALI